MAHAIDEELWNLGLLESRNSISENKERLLIDSETQAYATQRIFLIELQLLDCKYLQDVRKRFLHSHELFAE